MNPNYATLTTYNEVDASDLSRAGLTRRPPVLPPMMPFAILSCLLFSLTDQTPCGMIQLLFYEERFYLHLSLFDASGYSGCGLYFINDKDEKGELILALHQPKTPLAPPVAVSEPVVNRFSFPFNQLTPEQLLSFVEKEKVLVCASNETGECCEGVLRRVW